MRALLLSCFLLTAVCSVAQSGYYFPPLTGNTWDSVTPASLGWCTDKLDSVIDYARQKNSKALIILYKGKIVTEKYYDNFTRDSVWYWASAGKSLTSFLTGVAQDEGLLNIQDSTSKYLGVGWTGETPEQEVKIKLVHQLTMTTAIDYNVPDENCLIDTCLKYRSDAGTAWYYHNAPYRLLQDVVSTASGVSYNNYTNSRVGTRAGITGLWVNYVFYSRPRSAARFGLLMLANAVWNGDTLLHNQQYLNDSRNTSQSYNLSYGYLWWLNGKSSFMAPSTTVVFPGSLCSAAPPDMYAALGKDDQKIYIVPSLDLVVVRMGNDAGQQTLGPSGFDNEFWERMMQVFCNQTAINDVGQSKPAIKIFPNPASSEVNIWLNKEVQERQLSVYDISGRRIFYQNLNDGTTHISTADWSPGVYFVKTGNAVQKLIIE